MRPRPPAFETAAASRPPETKPIGAEVMGCSISSRSVSRVRKCIGASPVKSGSYRRLLSRLRHRGFGFERRDDLVRLRYPAEDVLKIPQRRLPVEVRPGVVHRVLHQDRPEFAEE